MKKLIQTICSKLESGEDLVLASIVKSSGSTPRSSGSKMVVMRDGAIDGTIGGGLVEALVQKEAANMFYLQGEAVVFKDFDLSNELAANADMICGGKVTVMLERLPAKAEVAAPLCRLNDLLQKGRQAVLFTYEKLGTVTQRTTITPACNLPEFDSIEDTQATKILESALKSGTPVVEELDSGTIIAEAFVPQPDLFIFGAGHVSRPTAELAASVNFRTIVLDDRADFANAERFPSASEIHVLQNFKNCFSELAVNDNTYIIIVTRGHLHDKTVLKQALETPARYVGMIGSSRKRDSIYEALISEGVTQKDIDRCNCPIGIAIGAQTPEEIAVSIVGELIQTRAGQ